MKVIELIEELEKLPPDSDVHLTKVIAAEAGKEAEAFQVTLCHPIIGIADREKEVQFVIGSAGAEELGEITPLE